MADDDATVDEGTVLSKYDRVVHTIALQYRPRGNVDFDDVLSDGRFGLFEAVRRWDPAGGAALLTFAVPRIGGAIIDGIRRRHGRRYRIERVSLAAHPSHAAEDVTWADVLADPADLEAELIDSLHAEWLTECLGTLDDTQRFVVTRRLAGRTEAQIGGELGVTESRVCQILKSAEPMVRHSLQAAASG